MMYATFSPEDNKCRLYSTARLDAETYARVKAAGFKWAPKQELFVAPMWTPEREDLLLELCEEIGDEDYSALERSADRAERFENYRDKRATEAGASADAFESGPSAFGHQNAQRAERQAQRHDRKRLCACSQWSKAEYWQSRTQAVIAHALYKADPAVRRGRIKEIEKAQRENQKGQEEYKARWEAWQSVLTFPGLDCPIIRDERPGFIGISPETEPAPRMVYALVNSYHDALRKYTHPRTGEAASLYSLLTDPVDPITAREAATLWLQDRTPPEDPDSYAARWARHYELRLTYERAMLAEEGGSAADADMEPGGWIGNRQIQGVNRSPVTGKVVSVKLMAPPAYGNGPEKLRSFNIERLPEGAYRAPTDEERAAFQTATKERKAQEKAAKPKAPPLINPTDEDAQKLQDILNAAKRKDEPSTVLRMTQAQYSQVSKGSYARCETSDISECLTVRGHYHSERTRETVFKVRTTSNGYSARRVIILTDKPQKPIPWDDVQAARDRQPTTEKLTPRLWELAEVLAADWFDRIRPEMQQLIRDAVYVGWAYVSSMTQFGFTEAGHAAFKEFEKATTGVGVLSVS